MTMNGIDISSYQAGLNASTISADFVIVKATEGLGYVNPVGDTHYQQAKAAGKLLGVYHFLDATDPRAQADFFVSNIQGYVGEAVLFLDFEADGLSLGSNGAKIFLDRVRELTGVAPLIYMSKAVIHQMDWSAVASQYGLWAAQYANYTPTGYLSEPWTDDSGWGAWGEPAIYQYSSAGRLAGYNGNLDLDIAYMDREGWNKYAGKSDGTLPTPTPEPTPTSAIDQFKQAGDGFVFTKPFRADEVQNVVVNSNGATMWQAINYELAGGTDFNWILNGIPLAIVHRTDGGDNQNVQPGAMIAFDAGYDHGTIDGYDVPTNGIKINMGSTYGDIWMNADKALDL